MGQGENLAREGLSFERMLDDLGRDEFSARRPFAFGAAGLLAGSDPDQARNFAFDGDAASHYADIQSPFEPARPQRRADLAEMRRELAKARGVAELGALRRRWALAAHPDRVAPGDREAAGRLMAEINAAIDRAAKKGAA